MYLSLRNPFIFPFPSRENREQVTYKIHSEVSYEINIRRALRSMEKTSKKSLLRAYDFPALMGKRDFADK